MQKEGLLYEGKAKKVFVTSEPELLWVEFKDDATAFDGTKKESLTDKGVLNNHISSIIFEMLESKGVKTHFVRLLSEREMLVKRLEIIPVEVIVRNMAAGSISARLGLEEGMVFKSTVLEFCLKNDQLHDPLINHHHVAALGLAKPDEIRQLEEQALLVNSRLVSFFEERGITLVDFKLEFGRFGDEIILGDEISPDTCRLWDSASGEKLDKDRFRRDLGGVTDSYRQVLKRIGG